jgi:hypothetical protein
MRKRLNTGRKASIAKPQRKMREREQNKTDVSSTLSIRSKGAKGIPKMLERENKDGRRQKRKTEVESFSHA